jgi:hypothetical protein
MTQTALQWMRDGARRYDSRPKGGKVAATPQQFAKSPCCKLMLIKIPRGTNEVDHYRCAECGALFIWSGTAWTPCELSEKHRAQSRETVRR